MWDALTYTLKQVRSTSPHLVMSHYSHVFQVTTANGEVGTIEGSFGKSGKFKVQFPGGLSSPAVGDNSIQLTFKKFIFDKDKRHMAQ